MEQTSSNLFELQLDHQSSAYLRETAKWGKFLAIVGFIGCALIVLIGLFFGTFMSLAMGDLGGAYGGAMGAGMAIYLILIALLYFFPCLYMYRFATRMQVAIANNDQQNLTVALANLKSAFKFVGILTIVILSIYVLALVFAVIGAAMAGF